MAKTKDIPEIIKRLRRFYKKHRPPIVTEIGMRKDPFRVLISCVLSLRTKDRTTEEASERLFKVADTPEKLAKLDAKRIEKLIYPVGFYKTKARRVKEIAKTLIKKYGSRVPDSMEELLKLKGVGRKTANIVMLHGHNSKKALAVDAHVHVISSRLGLVDTKNADETEEGLREILPKKYWPVYNDLLVVYGQNICTTTYPKCGSCVIPEYCIYPHKDFSRKVRAKEQY